MTLVDSDASGHQSHVAVLSKTCTVLLNRACAENIGSAILSYQGCGWRLAPMAVVGCNIGRDSATTGYCTDTCVPCMQ